MNRNLRDVLNNLINITKEYDDDLTEDLTNILASVCITAPELMTVHWSSTSEALKNYCFDVNDKWRNPTLWQVKLISEWSTQSVECICMYYGLDLILLEEKEMKIEQIYNPNIINQLKKDIEVFTDDSFK